MMTPAPIAKDAPAVNPPGFHFGRFMLPDMTEHACQVRDLSVDGAIFESESPIPCGVRIVAYIEEAGRVEARVAEPVSGGFRVRFDFNDARRERFQAKLDWLSERGEGNDSQIQRRHIRHTPKDTKSHMTLPDGRVYDCEVLDISLSGAAVKTDVMPTLGTYLLLGKMRGRVVRYHSAGIALEFVQPLDRAALRTQIS